MSRAHCEIVSLNGARPQKSNKKPYTWHLKNISFSFSELVSMREILLPSHCKIMYVLHFVRYLKWCHTLFQANQHNGKIQERFKLSESRMFFERSLRLRTTKIKAACYWLLWEESTGQRWILQQRTSNAKAFASHVVKIQLQLLLSGSLVKHPHSVSTRRDPCVRVCEPLTHESACIIGW